MHPCSIQSRANIYSDISKLNTYIIMYIPPHRVYATSVRGNISVDNIFMLSLASFLKLIIGSFYKKLSINLIIYRIVRKAFSEEFKFLHHTSPILAKRPIKLIDIIINSFVSLGFRIIIRIFLPV